MKSARDLYDPRIPYNIVFHTKDLPAVELWRTEMLDFMGELGMKGQTEISPRSINDSALKVQEAAKAFEVQGGLLEDWKQMPSSVQLLAPTRIRPKAMCDRRRISGTTTSVSTPLCEKQ